MTDSTERPFALTLLAILAGIAAVLGIGAALGRPDEARPLIDDFAALRVGSGLAVTVWLAIAAVNAALAYGFWTMRGWAWVLGIVVQVVAVILDLAAMVAVPGLGFAAAAALGVHSVLLAYLVTPATHRLLEAAS